MEGRAEVGYAEVVDASVEISVGVNYAVVGFVEINLVEGFDEGSCASGVEVLGWDFGGWSPTRGSLG